MGSEYSPGLAEHRGGIVNKTNGGCHKNVIEGCVSKWKNLGDTLHGLCAALRCVTQHGARWVDSNLHAERRGEATASDTDLEA